MKSQFPTVRYHRDGRYVIVRFPEELAGLSAEWRDVPTAHLSEEEYAERHGGAVSVPSNHGIPEPSDDPESPADAANDPEAPIVKRGPGRPRKIL